jgi:hypothetical protein
MAVQRRQRRIAAEAVRRGLSLRQHVAAVVRAVSGRALRRSPAVLPTADIDLDESAARQKAAVTPVHRKELEWPDQQRT